MAKFCSPAYHANNLMSPVLFYEGIQKIPDNAIVLEVNFHCLFFNSIYYVSLNFFFKLAPHCLLQAILRRCLKPTCISMGLNFNISLPPAKGKPKIESNLEYFKTTLGKMYVNGLNVYTKHLYPAISYPVPTGVPMISSLVKWDHAQTWDIMTFTDVIAFGSGGKVTSCSFVVDPFNPDVKVTLPFIQVSAIDNYLIDCRSNSSLITKSTVEPCSLSPATCIWHGEEFVEFTASISTKLP